MKKIGAFAVLPIIALSACGKQTATTITPVAPIPTNNETTNTPGKTETSSETLNENINTSVTEETGTVTKEFKLSYDLPDGRPLAFNGNLEITNGKITAINFPELDLLNGQGYEVDFAKKLQQDIVGKEIKGLQYDGMAGASLTTNAFNTFLNTINQ